MKNYVFLLLSILLFLACAGSKSSSYDRSYEWGPKRYWPPITNYSEYGIDELDLAIPLMKKDLKYYQNSNDPKHYSPAVEARNRLNVLYLLYAKYKGWSLDRTLNELGGY